MDWLADLSNALSSMLGNHGDIAMLMATVSLLTFVGSLLLIPWLVVRMPADYFTEERRHASQLKSKHVAVYWTLRILKNLLALLLVVAGIAMLILPGQGLLSILIGISISDFPGKYHLERYLVTRHGVLKSLNWVRHRAGKPDLIIDKE